LKRFENAEETIANLKAELRNLENSKKILETEKSFDGQKIKQLTEEKEKLEKIHEENLQEKEKAVENSGDSAQEKGKAAGDAHSAEIAELNEKNRKLKNLLAVANKHITELKKSNQEKRTFLDNSQKEILELKKQLDEQRNLHDSSKKGIEAQLLQMKLASKGYVSKIQQLVTQRRTLVWKEETVIEFFFPFCFFVLDGKLELGRGSETNF
jgi:chromosome segregation ATPase